MHPTSTTNSSGGPRLFLDSADPVQWERFLPLGLFHGITTNPLLLERAEQACTLQHLESMTARAGELGVREIQLQTWGDSAEELITTGRALAKFEHHGPRVTVKIPMTDDGLIAAHRLRAEGGRITMTAVFAPVQVLVAAAAGADYAAPYLGRLNDVGRDGLGILESMRDILAGSASSMRLLVASLRSADQVVDLARRGFDTFTFGPPVAEQMLTEDLTAAATADFQRAARAMGAD